MILEPLLDKLQCFCKLWKTLFPGGLSPARDIQQEIDLPTLL